MKTLITFLAACLCTTHAFAQTTYSVSNHALGGAQYADLQSAYNAANNDDILLIEGTASPYSLPGPGNVWNKSSVIIGQGFNTLKQGFETSKFQYAGWSASFTFANGASGSKIYGIDFIYGGGQVWLDNVNDLVFENCIFRVQVQAWNNSDNIVFKNCIFEGDIFVGSGASMNWLITNCVINGKIIGANTPQSIIVDHCLFLSSGGYFTNLDQAEIKNSIFMNSNIVGSVSECSFQNNLTRIDFDGDGDTQSFIAFPLGNDDLGGNLVALDPLMVTYPLGAIYASAHDYHLQPGSPAIGAAADGTDIGVHGGFTHFSEHGEPLVTPVIRSMNVINTSVAPGGTLNVQVVAGKPYEN